MFFYDFISNHIVLTATSAWVITQIMKFFVAWITDGKPDYRRLYGDGGMPSGHSATVTGMALIVGYTCGFHSPVFGIAFIFAIVVMHDASGVRRETGKQAAVLIDIVAMLGDVFSEKDSLVRRQKLKTMVGHTPLQVICGAILGIAVSALYILIFRVPYLVYA